MHQTIDQTQRRIFSEGNTSISEILQDGIGELEVMEFKEDIVVTLLVMCCLSTMLQLWVCSKAIDQIRKHTSERCMHIFLLNMTTADLLLTGIGYPMEFLQDMYDLGFNYYVNLMMHFILWLGTAVSGLSLVLMNLDKLVYFKFPLSYSKRLTRDRAVCFAVGTWICSVLFVSTAFITHAVECRYNCQTLTMPTGSRYAPFIYLLFTCCVSVVPALSSLCVALYLLRVVSEHRKHIAEERRLCPTAAGMRRENAVLARMRTFYFIFVSTIFTSLTLIPYRTLTIYRTIFQADTEIRFCLPVLISIIAYYSMDLNSVIIYSIFILCRFVYHMFSMHIGSFASEFFLLSIFST
ncbi:unnamed protein product [Anisakis simplex]|uniref:G_PROTEIN_RECEP_F1_2 domain-containing protein n=1 Tax=Anisakis simplex TaxID=6269 RepID=A0A0M3K011_ANISI|nr:unnamed protein product [Anisakis simplex]